MSRILALEGVNKHYYTDDIKTLALNNVSLLVNEGDFVAICGPSGCGKSTFLSVLGLLEDTESGTYNTPMGEMFALTLDQQAKFRSDFIGFVFQSFHLIDDLTVLENVLLPLRYSSKTIADAHDRALELLAKFNLSHRSNHLPSQLSGGQQQRVAIARALISEPKILLVDEATGNLDSENSEIVMQLLKQLNDDGLTIVMVTHDEACAKYSKSRLTMIDGNIEQQEAM